MQRARTARISTAGTSPQKAMPRPAASALGQKTVVGMIGAALAKARRPSAFLRAMAEDIGKDARRKIRWLTGLVIILVLVLGGGVYGVYWLLSQQVEHTKEALRSSEDSARAESDRLRHELAAARAAAAPAS